MVDTVKIGGPPSTALVQARQVKGTSVPPSVQLSSAMGQPDVVQISDVAQEKAAQDQAVAENRQKPEPKPSYRAILALDEDKNVVVQVVNDKGEVVRQVPPEDYVAALKRLREVTNHLFHVKG